MLADFKIAETDNFRKKMATFDFKSSYKKISNYIYPQLIQNPFFGPNIKKLKGKLSNIYHYRVGKLRIFYTIDSDKKLVFMIDINKRKEVYRN